MIHFLNLFMSVVGGRINIKDLKNPSREEKITPVHQI